MQAGRSLLSVYTNGLCATKNKSSDVRKFFAITLCILNLFCRSERLKVDSCVVVKHFLCVQRFAQCLRRLQKTLPKIGDPSNETLSRQKNSNLTNSSVIISGANLTRKGVRRVRDATRRQVPRCQCPGNKFVSKCRSFDP